MRAEQQLLSARSVRWLDVGVVIWIVVWVALGVLIWHDISAQAQLGANVIKVGTAVKDTGQALGVVGGLPLVGGQIGSFADRIKTMGAEVAASGQDSRSSIRRTAVVAGLGVGILPAALVLLLYLPARLRWRRYVGADRAGAAGRRRRPGVRAVPGAPGLRRPALGLPARDQRRTRGATSAAASAGRSPTRSWSAWGCAGLTASGAHPEGGPPASLGSAAQARLARVRMRSAPERPGQSPRRMVESCASTKPAGSAALRAQRSRRASALLLALVRVRRAGRRSGRPGGRPRGGQGLHHHERQHRRQVLPQRRRAHHRHADARLLGHVPLRLLGPARPKAPTASRCSAPAARRPPTRRRPCRTSCRDSATVGSSTGETETYAVAGPRHHRARPAQLRAHRHARRPSPCDYVRQGRRQALHRHRRAVLAVHRRRHGGRVAQRAASPCTCRRA